MNEYEVYWLMDYPLINSWVHAKKTKTRIRKISNFTVNRDHNAPADNLVGIYPVIQSCQDELKIKCPIEYLQV